MKTLLIIATLLVSAVGASAQNHSATISWVASPTPGVTYSVYRASCLEIVAPEGTVSLTTCSVEETFVKIADTSALSYVDTTVTAADGFAYYVTASDGTSESVPSNHSAALVPKTVAGEI